MSELEHQSALSRRDFLVGLAGAAAMFAFAPAEGTAAELGSSPFEPTIWYSVDRSGIVTVNITRAEMGQHIGTAVARILADELEVEWSNVRISAVDTDPKWGAMMTGASNSVWADFPVYSRAGAAGRIALIEAGAKLLGVSPSQCVARQGAVFAANRSISYGEIVRRGEPRRKFTPHELAQLPIKPASERRLIGRKTSALDIPAKINGTARYGIDAAVAGMVYARPKIPPTRNGSVVRSVDDSAAKQVKGYLASLVLDDPSNTVPGWVVVCATSYPAAIRAADLVKVDWAAGDGAQVSEQDILDYGAKQIADPTGGALLVDDPAIEFGLSRGRVHARADVHHGQRTSCSARTGERSGVREGWPFRDSHRQSMAEPDFAGARAGAPPAAGAHRHAHLSDRRGIRAQAQRRLCGSCRAGRQSSWQTREAGADASRRYALRLFSLAVDPNTAASIR